MRFSVRKVYQVNVHVVYLCIFGLEFLLCNVVKVDIFKIVCVIHVKFEMFQIDLVVLLETYKNEY